MSNYCYNDNCSCHPKKSMLAPAAMWLMVGGLMLSFFPFLGDPYMTPRLLLPLVSAFVLLLKRSDKKSTLEYPALAFFVAACVSAVFSQDKYYAMIGSYLFPMDGLFSIMGYVCVLIAAARSKMELEEIERMVVACALPMSSYAIYQRFGPDPLLWDQGLAQFSGRVISTQGGPIFLGAMLVISVICALHLALKRQPLGLIGLAFALPALWLTQTRGAFLAAAVGCAVLFPRSIIVALPSVFFLPRLLVAQSDAGRLIVWKTSLEAFMEHPIFGYGPGGFFLAFRKLAGWSFVEVMGNATATQQHAHNEILQVLSTLGIVGFAAYAFLAYSVVNVARRHVEKRFLLALVAAYFVISSFNPVATSVIALMALIFGVASSRAEQESRAYAPAFAAALAFLVVGRMSLASYHFGQASKHFDKKELFEAASQYNRAAQLNKWEMIYTCRQVDTLVALSNYAAPGQRVPMVSAALGIAEDAWKMHPNDSYAKELYGKSILIVILAGARIDPKLALIQFNQAQKLAPTFEKVMWRRHALAKALNEKRELEFAERDINDLRSALAAGGRKS